MIFRVMELNKEQRHLIVIINNFETLIKMKKSKKNNLVVVELINIYIYLLYKSFSWIVRRWRHLILGMHNILRWHHLIIRREIHLLLGLLLIVLLLVDWRILWLLYWFLTRWILIIHFLNTFL